MRLPTKRESLAYAVVVLLAAGVVASAAELAHSLQKPTPAPETPALVLTSEGYLEKQGFPAVALQARAAIVYDAQTREVLFEKNADAQVPLASLTKIMTAYA